MSEGIVVRRIVRGDLERLKEIRLEAIQSHPEAFSRDPESERGLRLEDWLNRIEKGLWFVCEQDGTWAGIAALGRNAGAKTEHVGSFGSMYVRPAYRGSGVADVLVKAVLDEAAKHVEIVTLTVNAENLRAIALYERHGFREYGRAPRALKIDGRYHDELEMVRVLSTK
jgi:RimJ/RimL family protein N-acetyltransferase